MNIMFYLLLVKNFKWKRFLIKEQLNMLFVKFKKKKDFKIINFNYKNEKK